MNIKDVDFTEISDSDLIRILNFCETEFGYYGQYEFNNTGKEVDIDSSRNDLKYFIKNEEVYLSKENLKDILIYDSNIFIKCI